MGGDDDRVGAAFESGDRALERQYHPLELERTPCRVEVRWCDRERAHFWKPVRYAVRMKFTVRRAGLCSMRRDLQSIPAENNLGSADANTTARMVGSAPILSKTFPSSVQKLQIVRAQILIAH